MRGGWWGKISSVRWKSDRKRAGAERSRATQQDGKSSSSRWRRRRRGMRRRRSRRGGGGQSGTDTVFSFHIRKVCLCGRVAAAILEHKLRQFTLCASWGGTRGRHSPATKRLTAARSFLAAQGLGGARGKFSPLYGGFLGCMKALRRAL